MSLAFLLPYQGVKRMFSSGRMMTSKTFSETLSLHHLTLCLSCSFSIMYLLVAFIRRRFHPQFWVISGNVVFFVGNIMDSNHNILPTVPEMKIFGP